MNCKWSFSSPISRVEGYFLSFCIYKLQHQMGKFLYEFSWLVNQDLTSIEQLIGCLTIRYLKGLYREPMGMIPVDWGQPRREKKAIMYFIRHRVCFTFKAFVCSMARKAPQNFTYREQLRLCQLSLLKIRKYLIFLVKHCEIVVS